MSDLRDERVRETAERLIQNLDEQGECDATDDEVESLAREVLALREQVQVLDTDNDRLFRQAVELRDANVKLGSEITTLTRQRDEALAVAREAVEGMTYVDTVVRSAIGNTLRARLAALQEGA